MVKLGQRPPRIQGASSISLMIAGPATTQPSLAARSWIFFS